MEAGDSHAASGGVGHAHTTLAYAGLSRPHECGGWFVQHYDHRRVHVRIRGVRPRRLVQARRHPYINAQTRPTTYRRPKMIALLLPFLPVILSAIAALVAVAANWWLDVTDWQTAAIFSCALVACVYVAQSNKPWARLAITGIIGMALYLKGGIDKEAALLPKHEAQINAIHQGYADTTAAEVERQRRANAQAQERAQQAEAEHERELAALQGQLQAALAAAGKDVHANRPALSLDAVRRLNALRVRGAGS